MSDLKIHYHVGDLPANVTFTGSVAVDTEAMGLVQQRDRLCMVQLSGGNGECHLVHFPAGTSYDAPHLRKVLFDQNILKIFHFARFDMALIHRYLGLLPAPIYCTKIASRMSRTYTDRHGLKDLCNHLLGIELSKKEQTSDWGNTELTADQKKYAALDVAYLHQLKEKLDVLLAREDRAELATAYFNFLPIVAITDQMSWDVGELFSH